MQADDPYAYWRSLLERVPGGEIPQEPQAGFWRRRMGRGGPWQAVAIWPDEAVDGGLRCLDGLAEIEPWRVWDFVCVNATTEAAYRAKVAGIPYPDEFRVRGGASDDLTTDVAKAAAIGPPERRYYGNQQETTGGGDA